MTSRSSNYRTFFLTASCLAAAIVAFAVDIPIARAVRTWNTEPTIAAYLGYLSIFEPFGHGLGIAIILVALHQLDPARRWAIPRIAVCALAAGGLADLLKMVVSRHRPFDCLLDGSVWATFGDWLPLLDAGSDGQSFPSAHTATAVGLAAALIWLYPQGRLLFCALASLVGCQRIASMAHFPSDVMFGAAAGSAVAPLILEMGAVPKLLARLESRWRSTSDTSSA